MSNIKDQAEKALRFKPENLAEMAANVDFRPYFVSRETLIYAKEGFDTGGKKIKRFTAVGVRTGKQHELFDHTLLAKLLKEKTGSVFDPDCLPLQPEKLDNQGGFFFSLKDLSYWHFDGATLEMLSPALPANTSISPDRTKAVYEKEGNLFLIELPSMKSAQLTFDGTKDRGYGVRNQGASGFIADQLSGNAFPVGIRWSPDSSRFFTYLLDFTGVLDLTLVQSVPEGSRAVRPVSYTYKYAMPGDERLPTAQYLLYDFKKRAMLQIDVPKSNITIYGPISRRQSTIEWSDEGSYGLCYIMNRSFTRADIYVIDPETCSSHLLFSECSDSFLFFDDHHSLNTEPNELFSVPAARSFVTCERLGLLFWLSERDGIFDIFSYSLADGSCKKLTRSDCCVRQLLYVDAERRLMYFSASGRESGVNPYQRCIYSVGLDDLEIRLLSREKGDHCVFFPPDGAYFTTSVSAFDDPPVHKLCSVPDGSAISTICQADVSRLENAGYLYPLPLCEKGADGITDIYGVMFMPKDFDPAEKYPVAEFYYGGNQCTRAPQNFSQTLNTPSLAPCFSELGFITVIIDGRGTPLRGKAFHDYCYNNIGSCAGLEDHVAVLHHLCERYAFIDPDRIGVWGHSGGGFATVHCMVDHPELYKVGVSTGGNHCQEIYGVEWSERFMGIFDRALWEKQNAEHNVSRLQGKLLLMCGELDDNVHPANTMRIVDALIKANKDFELLIFPNLHHALRQSNYYCRKVLEFFLKNL